MSSQSPNFSTGQQGNQWNSKLPGNTPLVSVIIPCLNEERYIGTILTNLLEQDYPRERMEVIVADGMSEDNTRTVIGSFAQQHECIHLVDNPEKFVPFALNAGISRSKGDVILIMGSHAEYPRNYVSVLVKALFELDADNVGAICETRPPDGSLRAKAIACVISSAFGVGNAYFRTGAKKRIKVDTVPFGCYRRSVFERIGTFDEELLRNQDDEFNARLILNGGSVWLIPEISFVYYSRSSTGALLKMYYQYGLFKPLASMKNGKPATIRQLIPSGFLLFVLAGLPFSLLFMPFAFQYMAVLGLYILLDLVFSLKISINKKSPGLMFYIPWMFLLLHVSYGVGYFSGIIKFVLLKNKTTQIPSTR